MKIRYIVFGIVTIIIIYLAFGMIPKDNGSAPITGASTTSNDHPVEVIPVMHATAILKWANSTIYTDPTGTSSLFTVNKNPDIILVTDIHGDHLSTSTLSTVIGDAVLIVPQAVKDLLPSNLASHVVVMKNGDTLIQKGFTITAIPMYNLPESTTSRHVKGRGNGYILEKDGFRVYVAGDTSGTPEMRALKDIDIAFVPMNLPFTMGIEEAASSVLAFAPKQVYPYHYRGQDGLSDIAGFKALVDEGNKDIEVILKNWYPGQ